MTKITTSWNSNLKKYTAQTDERTLPYGTYGVQEISSSQGYKMTDGTEKIVRMPWCRRNNVYARFGCKLKIPEPGSSR